MTALNCQQKDFVEASDGAWLVVAGPGTGKTHAFTHRIARLIERGTPAEQILAVTFTRAAALEIHERLKTLLGPRAEGLWVDTFHAAALRVLREQSYPAAGMTAAPEEVKNAILADIIPRCDLPAFLEALRRTKQQGRWPEDEKSREYQARLREKNLLDFDDIFLFVRRLFDERPAVRTHYRDRFRHVLVDEFQDTSPQQYEFMRHVAGANLCVIGDPDQSIYGFLGEGFRPFSRFMADYPGHGVLTLSENYRSQATILLAAQQVIASNPAPLPRELTARLAQGLPVDILSFSTDRQEAAGIVRKIEALVGGSSHFTRDTGWAEKTGGGFSFQDIAVLYRTHAQARAIEEALNQAGLPFRSFGKKKPGVSALEDLADFQGNEGLPKGEHIHLMTLHRSKGLEFPVVFIAGLEEGLLPAGPRAGQNGDETLAEERRLFYVGMTRAKSRLFLTWTKERFIFGEIRKANASRFLSDIEEELRRLETAAAAPRKANKPVQPTLFEI